MLFFLLPLVTLRMAFKPIVNIHEGLDFSSSHFTH